MSNVLIGIIGVVLFIGLALAGALLLGADFMSATNDSKAAGLVAQIQQATSGATMYALKTGQPVPTGNVDGSVLIGRFVKTAPINPAGGGPAIMYDANAQIGAGAPGVMVTMTLKNFPGDQPICESVQRATGQIQPTAAYDGTVHAFTDIPGLPTTSGCISVGGRYVVYGRI